MNPPPDPPFFLSYNQPKLLHEYLVRIGVIAEEEPLLSIEPAGEGNMNLTVRVDLGRRSLIVKQSRPWVAKYPQIEAPLDRTHSEARFYLLASPHERVAARLPRLIEVDPESRVIVLEDLGQSADYTGSYAEQPIDPAEARVLAGWLADLHRLDFSDKVRQGLENRGMRQLNHEHLFHFPLKPNNGLELDTITPGLQGAARRLMAETKYRTRVAELGKRYLADGPSLLHGDFFPGSWLRSSGGPVVIDPEFAFFGPPEFDLGVLLGHLYLARQAESVHAAVVEGYRPPARFDWRLALGFAAVEIMRRLIGVAQLPIACGLEEKRLLLGLSQSVLTVEDPLRLPALLAGEPIRRRAADREGSRSA